jgi:hypothetical protein
VTARGWSSAGLKVVGDDPEFWTVFDAAKFLGPPELSPEQVRQLVRMKHLEPEGKRRTTSYGTSGRYARVYSSIALIKAYDALSQDR